MVCRQYDQDYQKKLALTIEKPLFTAVALVHLQSFYPWPSAFNSYRSFRPLDPFHDTITSKGKHLLLIASVMF